MKLVRTKRANAASWNEIIDAAWENYKANGRDSIKDAFTEALADKAIQRYQTKIVNGFARVGVQIDQNEPLTLETLETIIEDRTGLEINGLSPEAITSAVDKLLAQKLSDALGVTVTTVLNKDELINSLDAAIKEAIRSGKAKELISRHAMRAARKWATYARRGITTKEDQRRVDLREYQRKYRRTHRLVWD